jgi:hypothetical protein
VTFPQVSSICDSTSAPFEVRLDDADGTWEPYEILDDETPLTSTNLANVPLCDTANGSVGWLDLGCGNLRAHITDPCNDFITIPDWLQTHTGNINCCETQLNDYTGPTVGTAEDADRVLLIPIHNFTCDRDFASTVPVTACPSYPNWSGGGNLLFYHVPFWIGFKIDQANVNGGDVECRQSPGTPVLVSPTPPGKVGCLKGWFVEMVPGPGSVSTGQLNPGDAKMTGILLIE